MKSLAFVVAGIAILVGPDISSAQVTQGTLTITGAELPSCGGAIREAVARVYDVDQHSVVLTRITNTGDYDEGSVEFRADHGKLVDLELLHESLWATALAQDTRSSVLNFKVSVSGEISVDRERATLLVPGSQESIVLSEDPDAKTDDNKITVFQKLLEGLATGQRIETVTGRLEGWQGDWSTLLKQKPSRPRRILVTAFTTIPL